MNDPNDSSIFNLKNRPYPPSPGWSTSNACQAYLLVKRILWCTTVGKNRFLWIVLIKQWFVSDSIFCWSGPKFQILCWTWSGPFRDLNFVSVRDEPVFSDTWYHSDNIYFPCWWIFVGLPFNLPEGNSKTSKRHRNGLYN